MIGQVNHFEISLPANKNNLNILKKEEAKKLQNFQRMRWFQLFKNETTAFSLTFMLTQAKDDVLVHDYKIIAKRVR